MRRKKERSKQVKQTNKVKQHSTPKAVKKLPRVGLEPTTRQSALPTELPRQLSWLGPNHMYMLFVTEESLENTGKGLFTTIPGRKPNNNI